MRTDDFDFELPRTAIAQHPVDPRDAARLLVVDPGLEDRSVAELPGLLRPGDMLVVNDTRVIPARLFGRRGQAKVEVTLTAPEPVNASGSARWRALARPVLGGFGVVFLQSQSIQPTTKETCFACFRFRSLNRM